MSNILPWPVFLTRTEAVRAFKRRLSDIVCCDLVADAELISRA